MNEIKTNQLFLFPTALKRDPNVDRWFDERPADLSAIARTWFDEMRACGDDVHELLHDYHPTACVGDAAFGYVNVFTNHVNVGFFRGTEIDDPTGLFEGTGKYMRHVKLRPSEEADAEALRNLIRTAYMDMKGRI